MNNWKLYNVGHIIGINKKDGGNMKKIVSIVFISWLLLMGTALAAEPGKAEPYKIAVFKVLDTTGWTDASDRKQLSKRLLNELHVPLNGYLQKVKVFDENECLQAYQKLPESLRSGKERTLWLRGVAEELGADLILCLTVEGAYEHTWINCEGDLWYEGLAAVALDGWDTRAQKPLHRTANRWVHDDYSVTGGVNALLLECTEEILFYEKLRDRFFPDKKQPVK